MSWSSSYTTRKNCNSCCNAIIYSNTYKKNVVILFKSSFLREACLGQVAVCLQDQRDTKGKKKNAFNWTKDKMRDVFEEILFIKLRTIAER